MDAVYVDPINTVWTRFGSGLDYLKSVIKDSKLLSNPFDFYSSSSSGYMTSKRVLFPFADAGVPPSSTDLANSSLRQFISIHQRQIISVLSKLFGISVSAITTYFLLKWLTRSLDPTNADKFAAKSRAEAIMKQLGVDPKTQELNEYELVIASNIILPNQIDCSWEDIGGLDHIADELRETVIYPLRNFDIGKGKEPSSYNVAAAYTTKRSRLVQPPKGVLLFGPPGNAKTMIAKALAKESGARFINLQVSTLFDKWFGESQKRTEAVFSLAQKVQPVIIFIDEIDSFLRSRRIDDHECTSTMKTQFMTMWDGLTTSSQHNNRILIIGATNRPEDVDPAILRRMPQMFHIGLPNQIQRVKILKVILKDEMLADDVNLDEIASRSVQFSGSDLHELCRCAAMNSYIETVRNSQKKEQQTNQSSIEEMALPESNNEEENGHIIRKIDFDVAFEKLASKAFAMNINARERFDYNL